MKSKLNIKSLILTAIMIMSIYLLPGCGYQTDTKKIIGIKSNNANTGQCYCPVQPSIGQECKRSDLSAEFSN